MSIKKILISGCMPFGDVRYEHYKTSNKLPKELHIYPEHHDKYRRKRYRQRASQIKDKFGHLTFNNPHSPNYYSYYYLW